MTRNQDPSPPTGENATSPHPQIGPTGLIWPTYADLKDTPEAKLLRFLLQAIGAQQSWDPAFARIMIEAEASDEDSFIARLVIAAAQSRAGDHDAAVIAAIGELAVDDFRLRSIKHAMRVAAEEGRPA